MSVSVSLQLTHCCNTCIWFLFCVKSVNFCQKNKKLSAVPGVGFELSTIWWLDMQSQPDTVKYLLQLWLIIPNFHQLTCLPRDEAKGSVLMREGSIGEKGTCLFFLLYTTCFLRLLHPTFDVERSRRCVCVCVHVSVYIPESPCVHSAHIKLRRLIAYIYINTQIHTLSEIWFFFNAKICPYTYICTYVFAYMHLHSNNNN